MNNLEIGQRLVALCNTGNSEEAVSELYADDIVSIEGAEGDEMPARIEGIEAVRQKGDWWFGNNEVHSLAADGPYAGLAADQFAVQFNIDLTPTGGQRQQIAEVGLYSTRDGKVIQEEFLFHA